MSWTREKLNIEFAEVQMWDRKIGTWPHLHVLMIIAHILVDIKDAIEHKNS